MDFSDIEQAGRQVLSSVEAYAGPVLFGAGALGALIAVILVWRFLRTGELHAKLGTLAVTLATAFAMEGMFEVAHGPLGLNVAGSLMFCATFEIVMLHQGTLAAHKLSAKRPVGHPAPDISRHMAFVWLVSVASGVIASTASNSITEVVLRLATPPLAAGIWYMSLYADRAPTSTQRTSWIYTPRYIGIKLGVIRAGEQDLAKVDRDQRIDAITVTAHRLHHGSPRLAGRRRAKLRKLALEADDEMVAEAQRRVARVHRIEKLTAPDAVAAEPVDNDTRALLDEIRLSTRETTRRLRSELPPADQVWSNNVVRIPTSLMDQVRTTPLVQPMDHSTVQRPDQELDQVLDQPAVQELDQNPDQPAQVNQQVKARISRRANLVIDDSVPPRIQAMAKALAKRFKGDIPARRTVMERMGWTSTGDAQTAINLVRAQRAEQANDADRAAV